MVPEETITVELGVKDLLAGIPPLALIKVARVKAADSDKHPEEEEEITEVTGGKELDPEVEITAKAAAGVKVCSMTLKFPF